jgi:hypothetical protein
LYLKEPTVGVETLSSVFPLGRFKSSLALTVVASMTLNAFILTVVPEPTVNITPLSITRSSAKLILL